MPAIRHALTTRPNILALAAGAAVLIACSLLRVAGKPLGADMAIVGAVLSLLVFLIPGAVAGLIAPRSFFWDGAILGAIAAAFVTLQTNQFHQPNWSSRILYELLGMWACFTIPLCIVGALGGRLVSWRR